MPAKTPGRIQYASAEELPSGTLEGPQFSALIEFLRTSDEFELVADRKIDWARYQQEWKYIASGQIYVLDYPFEKARGRFIPREEHPTVHLFDTQNTR